MVKKLLKISLLILFFCVTFAFAYCLFYPRFTYVSYGYKWGESEIDNLSCDVRFQPKYKEQKSSKIKIYRSPYDIRIGFQLAENGHIAITKVRIFSGETNAYESDVVIAENVENGKWKSILYDKEVDLEYLDYNVALEYIKTVNGKEESGYFEVLLEREYKEEKYSMIDKWESI